MSTDCVYMYTFFCKVVLAALDGTIVILLGMDLYSKIRIMMTVLMIYAISEYFNNVLCIHYTVQSN